MRKELVSRGLDKEYRLFNIAPLIPLEERSDEYERDEKLDEFESKCLVGDEKVSRFYYVSA